MRVALFCHDKPGALHIKDSGIVEMAGPLLTPEGQMCGSLIVLSVDALQQAQDWADADPYAKAGLFASVAVTEWKKVVG
jgi:uncharacterized protein YciI